MKHKTTIEVLTELLIKYPKARATDQIWYVLEWMMKYYGAITKHNTWDHEAYNRMPSLEGILRDLRRVKKAHGWQDDKAKEREEEERQEQSLKTVEEETKMPWEEEMVETTDQNVWEELGAKPIQESALKIESVAEKVPFATYGAKTSPAQEYHQIKPYGGQTHNPCEGLKGLDLVKCMANSKMKVI